MSWLLGDSLRNQNESKQSVVCEFCPICSDDVCRCAKVCCIQCKLLWEKCVVEGESGLRQKDPPLE